MTDQNDREKEKMSREFWIHKDGKYPAQIATVCHSKESAEHNVKHWGGEAIHVIEYSAYEKLRQQLAIAKEAMEKELEAMGEGNCCCGAEEQCGEGYTGVTCYLHEGLAQISEVEK